MIVWLLLKFFKNFCGEDEYQKSREIDKLPYINAKITIKNKIDNINDKIRATYEEYFSKKDEKAIKYENFNFRRDWISRHKLNTDINS